jgi:fatty-acyl-CoA synthase
VDRKDNLIISGGKNIYPREVEDILYQHPMVLEAAVVGVPDDYWGEAVKAIVVLKRDLLFQRRRSSGFAENTLQVTKAEIG